MNLKSNIVKALILYFSLSSFCYSQSNNQPSIQKKETIAHNLLNLEFRFLEKTKSFEDSLTSVLNKIIYNSTNKIRTHLSKDNIYTKKKAIEILKIISNEIKNNDFSRGYDIHNISQMITEKKFDCDTGSILYLAISEVNELPIYMVEVPLHNFVRFYYDKGEYINWDVNHSKVISDSEYLENYSSDIPESVKYRYLQPMTQRNVKAFFYSLLDRVVFGTSISNQMEAKKYFDIAIQERPYSPITTLNYVWFILNSEALNSNKSDLEDALINAIRLYEMINEDTFKRETYLEIISWAYLANGYTKQAEEIRNKN
jgi:hypothetical protein